eukprot:GHVU01021618.1.p1 GENE.GHVU01021618.1~~GHVU01021618.1.p1  ORF type:complete len:176 (-),score=10.86 GHVU01021618.1:122-649(-)
MAPSKKENKKKKTLPKRERGRQRAATESEKDHEEVEIEVGGLTAAGLGAQGRGRGTSGGVLRSVATGPEVPSRGTTTTPQVTPVTHQFTGDITVVDGGIHQHLLRPFLARRHLSAPCYIPLPHCGPHASHNVRNPILRIGRTCTGNGTDRVAVHLRQHSILSFSLFCMCINNILT